MALTQQLYLWSIKAYDADNKHIADFEDIIACSFATACIKAEELLIPILKRSAIKEIKFPILLTTISL